ncbi:MAG TPA: tetratricopeptide repeat protein [Candidatus Limnocylindrales bacterium]|nr:tetratricopeptide repeat protein [Candidatus Limnocylindrales bacterium]
MSSDPRPPIASQASVQEALDHGDHQAVLRLTEEILASRPGDDAAHELRARSMLALGRIDEAERHVSDAVRLDPDEIRYRELLAQVLAARGAHRDAAADYGRLARNDARQRDWVLAEAGERLSAADAVEAVDAARRAVRLSAADPAAQLALGRALVRVGDGSGALAAATIAVELLPGDARARETLADARWLTQQDAAAFADFRTLAGELAGADRDRVIAKARALYRRRAGPAGRLLAGWPWLFGQVLRAGWI